MNPDRRKFLVSASVTAAGLTACALSGGSPPGNERASCGKLFGCEQQELRICHRSQQL